MTRETTGTASNPVEGITAKTRQNFGIPVLAAVIWCFAIGAGTAALLRFEFTAGDQARAPGQWPEESLLPRSSGRRTLLLFVHPHCVCTRASLNELQVILSQAPDALHAQVIFVQLPGFTDAEVQDGSWDQAGRISGLTRRVDINGAEARRFQAQVSGYTVIYDAQGRLEFDGGITGSRGQTGANAGRNSVMRLLQTGTAEVRRTKVFGCYLLDHDEHPRHHAGGA